MNSPQPMHALLALYVKELRGIRLVAVVLLVGVIGLVAYVIQDAADGGLRPSMGLLVLPYLCPPVLAGLLIHSVGQEWAGNTQHQWLALPVSRSTLLLAKLAAVLTLAAGVFVINTAGLQLIQGQIVDSVAGMVQMPNHAVPLHKLSPGDLWSATASIYGGVTMLLVGLGLLAASLRTVVTRFRGLLTVAVFLTGLWVSAKITHALAGGQQTQVVADGHILSAVSAYGFLALVGVGFAAIGLVIFDKFVDA